MRARDWSAIAGLLLLAAGMTWKLMPDDAFTSDESLVHAEVALDPGGCDATHPVRVEVRNRSKKTLKSLDLTVHIYERGSSEDLATWPGPEWTTIVGPNETSRLCFRLNTRRDAPPSYPVVTIESRSPAFYRDGEVIPR